MTPPGVTASLPGARLVPDPFHPTPMKLAVCALAVCASMGLCTSPLAAQGSDARVIPRGVLRVEAAGVFTHFGDRFDGGAEGRIGFPLETRLDPELFPPLQALLGELDEFFAETDSVIGTSFQTDPQTLFLQSRRLEASAGVRTVPFGIEVGIARNLSVGASVSVRRSDVSLDGLRIGDGTVGANPDPEFNQRLVGDSVPTLTEIAASPLLPVAGSAAAVELQRRVRALFGGQELRLPTAAIDAVPFDPLAFGDSLDVAQLGPGRSEWELGEVELGARYQLLNTQPGFPYPDPPVRLGFRSAVELRVRLPTGTGPDPRRLLPFPSAEVGPGVTGRWLGDAILGERFWATIAGSYSTAFATTGEERLVRPDLPLASPSVVREVRRAPGDRWEVEITPRFRLTDEISFSAQYLYARRGAGEVEALGDPVAEGVVPFRPFALDADGTTQRWGVGARYNTLHGAPGDGGALPFELSLLIRNTFAGTAGAADATTIELQGRVYRRLWGES